MNDETVDGAVLSAARNLDPLSTRWLEPKPVWLELREEITAVLAGLVYALLPLLPFLLVIVLFGLFQLLVGAPAYD